MVRTSSDALVARTLGRGVGEEGAKHVPFCLRVEVVPTPWKLPPVLMSGCYMAPALAGLHKSEGTGDEKQLIPTFVEVVPKSCKQGF